MKRTTEMARGNVTDRDGRKNKRKVAPKPRGIGKPKREWKAGPVLTVRSLRAVGGTSRRAMKKRQRINYGALAGLAMLAGPIRESMLQLMAFAQQRAETDAKRKEELRKAGKR